MRTANDTNWLRLIITFFLLTAAATFLAATPEARANKNNLVFILDASGSMWGQVEKTAKITIAKDVLTGLINDLPPDTNVGLVAYGHRRKGDCKDVEELVPIGALDKKSLIAKIKGLNPKGKTPITHSVQLTAEKLKALEDETTIILVSDGKETCEGDPCVLVRELKKSGIRFVMHVIGFDVTDEERNQLECIAEAGGGMYYSAKNAGEFQIAATKVVTETQTVGFLEITALRNGKPVAAHIDVFTPDRKEKVTTAGTTTSIDKPVSIKLQPGSYAVRVTDTGLADKPSVMFADIEIEQKKTVAKTAEFVVSSLKIMATKQGKPFRSHVFIFPQGEKSYLTRKDTSKEGPAVFEILPGTYDIKVEDFSLPEHPVVKLKGVEIKSGETVEKVAEFMSEGTLSLTALKGGKLFRSHVFIFPEGEKSYLTRKDTSKEGPAVFELLPGIYDIKVEDFTLPDHPVVHLKGVEITSGTTVEKVAEFVSEGSLSLTALKGGKLFRSHVFIFPEGEKSYLTRKDTSKEGPAVFELLPGTYDIKVEDFTLPDHPVVHLKGVEIKSGETVEEVAEFVSEGTLSLTALKGGKLFRAHVYVFPEGEKSYLTRKDTSKEGPAVFDLLPGIYDIKVEDFTLPDHPVVHLKGVEVKSDATVEKVAEFMMEGTLSLTAVKGGKLFRAHVYVFPEGEKSYLTRKDTSKEGPAVFHLLPGVYDLKVEDFSFPDHPVKEFKGVHIESGKTKTIEATF